MPIAFDVQVHAYIISHLKQAMPILFGKNRQQAKLIEHLDEEFVKIQHRYNLSPGDFPDVDRFRHNLQLYNFDNFKRLDTKLLADEEEVL